MKLSIYISTVRRKEHQISYNEQPPASGIQNTFQIRS